MTNAIWTTRVMLTIFFLAYAGLKSYAQQHYKIEFNIKYSDGKKIYLANALGGPSDKSKVVKVDSAIARNNKCVFKGTFKEMGYYSLAVEDNKNYASFIIDTGTIVVDADARDYLWKSFSVNSIQNIWAKEAQKITDSLSEKREKLQDSLLKYQGTNKQLSLDYKHCMDTLDMQMADYLKSFTAKHPNSYYALNKLKSIYYYTPEVSKITTHTLQLFSQQIKNSAEWKYLQLHLIENYDELLIGKPIPPIKGYDKHKKIHEMRFKRGNVYLIDYWASWCVPCIANFPNLKKYEMHFRHKGFKIISISLDNNHKAWLNALKKHNIHWTHYRDIKAFDSPDVKIFGIREIPFMILVGRNGRIAKLNLSDKEIETYLSNL